ALVVPVLGILPWIIVQKRWKDVLQYGVFAIFAVVLIVLPWAWAIHAAEPDFWHYFLWVEHIQRFSGENAQHKAPFWFYIPILIVGSLPWFALLPGALIRGWQERQAQRGTLYLLGWAVIPFLFFSITKGKLLTYIMPCFSPLAILMAHHAVQWARTGERKLRINGCINVAFGVTGVVIVLTVLAPWGGRYSIYAPTETVKMLFACLAFTFWAGFGAMALDPRRWYWAAGCPLGIALLVGAAIPEKVSNAEQPQAFIREVHSQLEDSRYILTNNVGVGAAIAWEIKRSDIYLYSHKGELRYGLGYEDAEGRYIAQHAFVDWLAEHRREGKVTLLLLAPKQKNLDDLALPAPDRRLDKGRLVLFEYERRP
ncbi:TPA: phospholipid carrier-dependent glycosyltransferase, partial [Serratia marcescens]